MSTLGERLSVVATENAKLHIEIDKLAENNETRVIAVSNRVGPMVQDEVVNMFAENVQKNLKKISRQRLNIEM